MKKTILIGLPLMLLALMSCGKKENDKNIIISKPVTKVQKKTEKMDNFDYSKKIEWQGGVYTIEIRRYSDEGLPVVKDESGRDYYDNKINLKVMRKDGSEFFNRTFTKEDFRSCLGDNYSQDGALLGLMFTEVMGDNIKFVGSVGSPDQLSDEYIPMVVMLSKSGNIQMKRETQLDVSNDNASAQSGQELDEDGV